MNGTALLVARIARLARLARSTGPIGALALSTIACGGSNAVPPPNTPAPKTAATSSEVAPTEGAAPTASAVPAPAATGAEGHWPFLTVSDADRAQQIERLKQNPGPIKSNWVPPGKSDRYGHAEGLVPAGVDAVRARLLDFPRYKDLAGPKFKSVKVVDKQGDNTDVYFQLPIMKGMITIWYVTRFPHSRPTGSGDVLEGTFVKGNIKNMHIAFTVRPGVDDTTSVLVCDLVLQPNVPAPQSALDEELRDACGDAINSLKKTIATNP